MEEELNKVISEEQRDQLIGRINELYENGVMRMRDWMAIYDLMLEACERDAMETYEEYVAHSIEEESGDTEKGEER